MDGASLISWLVVFLLVVVIGYYVSRMAKDQEEDARHDTGLAILEFGRAFPNEAIRSLHQTSDGSAIFVRLHDNKAGIMRNHRAHYACHLIEPGRVRVQPLPNGRGFSAEFLDSPTQNGNFIFGSEQEVAEVLLWLLGNYVPSQSADADAKGHPHHESGHSSV